MVDGLNFLPSLLPGKSRYKSLGGSQDRFGRLREIAPSTGIRSPDRPVAVPTELSRPTIRRPKGVLLLLAIWFFHKIITTQHSKFSHVWQLNISQRYTQKALLRFHYNNWWKRAPSCNFMGTLPYLFVHISGQYNLSVSRKQYGL